MKTIAKLDEVPFLNKTPGHGIQNSVYQTGVNRLVPLPPGTSFLPGFVSERKELILSDWALVCLRPGGSK